MTHYNIGLERAVLAYALYSGEVEVFKSLDDSCFYIPDNRAIRKMLIEAKESGMPIAIENITPTMLIKHNISEEAMLEVQAATPTNPTDNVVGMLAEMADKRKVHTKLTEMMMALSNRSSIDVARMLTEAGHDVMEDLINDDSAFEMVSVDDIDEPPVEFAGHNFLPLPRKAVVVMAGRGGVGKSGIALQSAMRHINDTGEKVFCWLSEDPLGETRSRTEQLCHQIGIPMQELHEKLWISNRKPFNVAINMDGNIVTNPEFTRLKEACKDFGMIVIDPLRSFASNFDENSNSDMDNVTKEFANWAKKENKIIVLIHHASKDGDIRGASSIVDAVRLAYTIKHGDETGTRWVEVTKDNFGVSKILRANRIKVPTLKE